MKRKTWYLLGLCILTPLFIGGVSVLFFYSKISMYDVFKKPLLAPPKWVFPIVWNSLYVLIGIVLFRISFLEHNTKKKLYIDFAIYFVLNFLWPIIFFRFENLLLAFIILLCMILNQIVIMVVLWKHDRISFFLNLLHVLWLFFACYLNFEILYLN